MAQYKEDVPILTEHMVTNNSACLENDFLPLDRNVSNYILSTTVPNMTASDALNLMRMVCEVWISLPLAVLGIIGNTLAFVVLCRQKQRLTTNILLQALAVADILVLISSILLRSLRFIGWTDYLKVYDYIFIALYPCVYLFRLTDTWITVIMTIDRYIAVCHPLHAQRLCTMKRTYIAIAVIALSTLLFSVPRFFEYRMNDDGYVPTPLVQSAVYTVAYRIVSFFLVMYLVPMALLIVLNVRLVYALRRAYADRDSMISNGTIHNGKAAKAMHNVSRSVTVIVAAVVIVSVICNVTAMTAHVVWAMQACFESMSYLEYNRRILAITSNVMVTFNCAVNFAIYCMLSRRFRSGLTQTCKCDALRRLTMRCCPDHKRNASTHSSYTSSGLQPLRGTPCTGAKTMRMLHEK